ncbi:DUF2793 domain-containing protein [Henriciella mobilis]|uniref:DUF2793 domain-containing protein n=1 Tax=Henriciella mobilis TaxID=2305467 RepID=UPI000E670D42|nr:DUF2793 domain-containing protein [Henriciella mobilis]RIJ17355.1 DUF2793 domain-containing protein [Henriciella mobilis]RIJ25656.1 DUF2793 domain-containing protein [Henriciella mobilis]
MSLSRLDWLVQIVVQSRSVAAEPAAPEDGAGDILPAGASGAAWTAAVEHSLAFFQDGTWRIIIPAAGWQLDAARPDGADLFGINASATSSQRLAVKSDTVLFSHDDVTPGSGRAYLALNKLGAANTSSIVFQTDCEGRAEVGLSGTDDLARKVSADGED